MRQTDGNGYPKSQLLLNLNSDVQAPSDHVGGGNQVFVSGSPRSRSTQSAEGHGGDSQSKTKLCHFSKIHIVFTCAYERHADRNPCMPHPGDGTHRGIKRLGAFQTIMNLSAGSKQRGLHWPHSQSDQLFYGPIVDQSAVRNQADSPSRCPNRLDNLEQIGP